MSKFQVKRPDGSESIETSETTSVDAYAMERWGANSAAELEDSVGVVLSLASEESTPIVEMQVGTPTEAQPVVPEGESTPTGSSTATESKALTT